MKEANKPSSMPLSLEEVLRQILIDHDGLCMDTPEEREKLLDALVLAINEHKQSGEDKKK